MGMYPQSVAKSEHNTCVAPCLWINPCVKKTRNLTWFEQWDHEYELVPKWRAFKINQLSNHWILGYPIFRSTLRAWPSCKDWASDLNALNIESHWREICEMNKTCQSGGFSILTHGPCPDTHAIVVLASVCIGMYCQTFWLYPSSGSISTPHWTLQAKFLDLSHHLCICPFQDKPQNLTIISQWPGKSGLDSNATKKIGVSSTKNPSPRPENSLHLRSNGIDIEQQ
jgi:hypothetical protein